MHSSASRFSAPHCAIDLALVRRRLLRSHGERQTAHITQPSREPGGKERKEMKRKGLIVFVAVLAVVVAGSALAADAASELMCKPCNMKFESKQDLARHAIEHHGAKGCKACGVLFENEGDAAVHAVLHHDGTSCPPCHKEFASNAEAQMHLIEAHGMPGCKLCKKAFENEEQAAEHAKMHEKMSAKKSNKSDS